MILVLLAVLLTCLMVRARRSVQRSCHSPLGATGMSKEMIISSSAHETRVAILEDDQVAEIFIERERSRGVVGNVYKGRVSKVLPGMQSAFVDLGLERDGFLYVSDVVATFEEFDRLETDDDDCRAGGTCRRDRNGAPATASTRGRASR